MATTATVGGRAQGGAGSAPAPGARGACDGRSLGDQGALREAQPWTLEEVPLPPEGAAATQGGAEGPAPEGDSAPEGRPQQEEGAAVRRPQELTPAKTPRERGGAASSGRDALLTPDLNLDPSGGRPPVGAEMTTGRCLQPLRPWDVGEPAGDSSESGEDGGTAPPAPPMPPRPGAAPWGRGRGPCIPTL